MNSCETRFLRPARNRSLGAVAGAAMATLVLVGCGGSSEGGALTGNSSSTSAPVTVAPASSSSIVDPNTTAPPSTTSPPKSPSTTSPPTTSPPTTGTTAELTITTTAPTTVAPTTAPPTTTAPPAPALPVPPGAAPANAGIQEPGGALRQGSKGRRTLALQLAFKAQHYDPGEPDGAFGLKTTQAVWAFQALHGLPTDGIVGPDLEGQLLANTPQPMLRPNLGPTHTEVDLTRQVLILFHDGQPTLITHVSSGSGHAYCENTDQGRNCGDAQTPTGVFTFYRRVQGIRDAPLGKLYDPVYFKGGYAVHGSPSVPNKPASHGCVRIPLSISDYFQTLVADGDKIEVFR